MNNSLNIYLKRKQNILYQIESQEDHWIILINDLSPDKRLLKIKKDNNLNLSKATEMFNKKDDDKKLPIIGYDVFKNHITILCKKNGIPKLFIEHKETLNEIPFSQESFALDLAGGKYNGSDCFLCLSTLTQPPSTIQLNLKTKEKKVVKVKNIPHFNHENYETKRLFATSQDGEKIPYTIAYKKGINMGNAPVYLYGYGSYSYPIDPNFSSTFITLIKRGFIVAIAHIRGGGDLGRAWYEAAKLKTKKKNL